MEKHKIPIELLDLIKDEKRFRCVEITSFPQMDEVLATTFNQQVVDLPIHG